MWRIIRDVALVLVGFCIILVFLIIGESLKGR